MFDAGRFQPADGRHQARDRADVAEDQVGVFAAGGDDPAAGRLDGRVRGLDGLLGQAQVLADQDVDVPDVLWNLDPVHGIEVYTEPEGS